MTAIWPAANPGQLVEQPTIEAAREWCQFNGGSGGIAVYFAIEWPPVLPRIRAEVAA